MRRGTIACCALLVFALACGGEEPAEDAAPVEDTTAMTPGGAEETASGTAAESPDAGEEEATTTGGEATTATSTTATGAPAPPGGYAVESRPAEGGKLARIEYASPRTVAEVAEFYDGRIETPRKVEVDVAGDDLVAYALSSGTTLEPSTTAQDVERLIDQRTEPIVVVSPWQIQRDDPLIRDLRDAGLGEQADQLLNTKSKVTVVYAVR
ncbi:MAG: hypothetical protein R3326_00265 [Gemmatimonadota bacterium]|nr:hypothetical protein [Gemmatimonadota bacterium]